MKRRPCKAERSARGPAQGIAIAMLCASALWLLLILAFLETGVHGR